MVEGKGREGRARDDPNDCTGSTGHLRFAPRSLPWRAARHPVKSLRWPTAARLERGRLRLRELAEVCCARRSAQRARVCAPQRATRCTVRNARRGALRARVLGRAACAACAVAFVPFPFLISTVLRSHPPARGGWRGRQASGHSAVLHGRRARPENLSGAGSAVLLRLLAAPPLRRAAASRLRVALAMRGRACRAAVGACVARRRARDVALGLNAL